MVKVRVTYPIPPDLNHNCDLMHIEDYQLEEVIIPGTNRSTARKALRITIRGRNFRAGAQPLSATVGKVPISYLRIEPDERSIEGILLSEPEKGSHVEVFLGDEDAVRHPTPFDSSKIKRIDEKNSPL